jgi:CDP-paratose 2-epimerase
MTVAIVTGAGGLVGAEASARFCALGYDVVGIENDMRSQLFGPSASTKRQTQALTERYDSFHLAELDVRDGEGIERLFGKHAPKVEIVVHAAGQPSHDWAAVDPSVDFAINATGTLNVLEAVRRHCPAATFVYCSTNKVYGNLPSELPLLELEMRFDLAPNHVWHGGIDTTMSIDRSLHSLLGVSKAAADLLVQEYGRYFEVPTVCFRAGCVTGPRHSGTRWHGFLSYLMRATVTGEPYTVYGHRGKQVRDNLHSADLVRAFEAFHASPRAGAVYNVGGGRFSNCSMLEAIELCQEIAGRPLDWSLAEHARIGDHRWWISDLKEFQTDYPEWAPTIGVRDILREIHDENADEWTREPLSPQPSGR